MDTHADAVAAQQNSNTWLAMIAVLLVLLLVALVGYFAWYAPTYGDRGQDRVIIEERQPPPQSPPPTTDTEPGTTPAPTPEGGGQ